MSSMIRSLGVRTPFYEDEPLRLRPYLPARQPRVATSGCYTYNLYRQFLCQAVGYEDSLTGLQDIASKSYRSMLVDSLPSTGRMGDSQAPR